MNGEAAMSTTCDRYPVVPPGRQEKILPGPLGKRAMGVHDSYVFVIGVVASSLTTVSLLPQLVRVLRHRAKSLSMAFLFCMLVGLMLWVTYGVLTQNSILIVSNSISVTIICVMLAVIANDRMAAPHHK